MKTKKNRTSKKIAILPVAAMLLTGIISVTGVTYAWFSSGDTASVDTIDLNVKAADGILASWTGNDNTWQSALVVSEGLTAQTNSEGAFIKIPTVISETSTTHNSVAAGVPSFFTASLQADGVTIKTEAEANIRADGSATVNYLIFDMYFKVDSTTNLYLGTGSQVISYDLTGVNNETQNPTDTDKAVRVGFIDQGNSDTANVNVRNLNGGSSMVIWEPNDTAHIAASGEQGNATKLDYYGVKAASNGVNRKLTPVNDGDEGYGILEKVTTYSTTQLSVATENATPIATLEAGYNKLTVCIWLEGQDVDCLNDISGSTLHTTLNFSRKAIN